MDEPQFTQLQSKLDIITKLLAMNLLQGKTPMEQIAMLSQAGLRPVEISRLTGKSDTQVSVTLTRIKKAREKHQNVEQDTNTGTSEPANV